LNDQLTDPLARKEFVQKIGSVIDCTKEDIAKLELAGPGGAGAPTALEQDTVGDWLESSIHGQRVGHVQPQRWDMVARLTEYLVNPGIKKKNIVLVNELIEDIMPALERGTTGGDSGGLVKDIQTKAASLHNRDQAMKALIGEGKA